MTLYPSAKESHVPPEPLACPQHHRQGPLRPAVRHLRPGAGPHRGRSCYRTIEKYAASTDDVFRARAIGIKEERADLVKHHLDVLWHDYFKPEHLDKVPNLHDLFWNANKQASKVKASTDLADAKKLLDMIDEIDAAWKATGGEEKTRVAGRPS